MKISGFLSVAFFLFISSLSHAQATATFTASVTIIEPIGITTTSQMNFASVDARSGGEVILSPDGVRRTAGGVVLSEGGFVSAASFEVTGEAGSTFSISIPETEYILTNGRESVIIKDFKSSLKGYGTLSTNSRNFSVGATLDIQDNQTPGIYTSPMPLAVTVNYN